MTTAPASAPTDLRSRLHRDDPFAGFDASGVPLDLQGWNGNHPLFGELIDALQPRLVIEVGTWKGQSAINMARRLQRLGPDRTLLCVDTWLGGVEHLLHRDHDDCAGLRTRHGYPDLYRQFLANVVHCGLQDVIVPFPQTSLNAARWLLLQRTQADLVYIDASHEENDVWNDLRYYWQLVRPGGVLFGDDLGWPGVRAAVDRFVREQEVLVGNRDNLWILPKPAA